MSRKVKLASTGTRAHSRKLAEPVDSLFDRVAAILEQARSNVVRSVNSEMLLAYWHIGREIVQVLQGGEDRAEYGELLIGDLSNRLTQCFGKGFSTTNLRYFRAFYQAYSERSPEIRHPSGGESRVVADNRSQEIDTSNKTEGFSPMLGWSHYRALMRVEKPEAREFYERECAACSWTKVELERQISTMYYERLLMSREKAGMLSEGRQAASSTGALTSLDVLKDPYVLEFLDLPEPAQFHEADLETAIIDNLQQFLLELGKGFAFVARQKRLRFGDDDFYVDLVFYNYLLKCFLLIDLKVGKLTHQDVGQMDSYVRLFEAHAKSEGDNPTIGLILCSDKNEAMVRYSMLADSEQLFAAKYLLYLPGEEELQRELERERRILDARAAKRED